MQKGNFVMLKLEMEKLGGKLVKRATGLAMKNNRWEKEVMKVESEKNNKKKSHPIQI